MPIIKTIVSDLKAVDLLIKYFQNLLDFQSKNLDKENDYHFDNFEIGLNLKNILVSITNLI